MKHVSADCETLSLNENPALLSIGAVVFDPEGNDTVESLRNAPTFSAIVDLKDQVERYGRHIDPGTIMWWMKQPDEARKQVIANHPEYFAGAMFAFGTWINEFADADSRLWTHGAAEDAVWLRSAWRSTHPAIPFPIHYRNIRDTRTLFDLMDTPEIVVPGLVDHVALDDAIYQALRVQHAYRQLKSLKSLETV